MKLTNSILVIKRSFLYAVSNIFDITNNIECSFINFSNTFDFNNPFIIIDKIRIILSYFIIHFIFFYYNLIIIKIFRKNLNSGIKH